MPSQEYSPAPTLKCLIHIALAMTPHIRDHPHTEALQLTLETTADHDLNQHINQPRRPHTKIHHDLLLRFWWPLKWFGRRLKPFKLAEPSLSSAPHEWGVRYRRSNHSSIYHRLPHHHSPCWKMLQSPNWLGRHYFTYKILNIPTQWQQFQDAHSA